MNKKALYNSVMRRTGGRCAFCGDIARTLDHIVPKSAGGRFVDENLQPLCNRCNGTKGSQAWVRSFDDLQQLRKTRYETRQLYAAVGRELSRVQGLLGAKRGRKRITCPEKRKRLEVQLAGHMLKRKQLRKALKALN